MKHSERKKILTLEINVIREEELLDIISSVEFIDKHPYLCFANVHMCMETYWDLGIRKAINNASYVLADGVPLLAAMRLLYGIKQERIAGMDYMPVVMGIAEKIHESVFFYGSTENILQEIVRKVKSDYPHLTIAGILSPPFRKLSDEENRDHIRIINESGAKYIFVGLGCPKQELWMAANHENIDGILLGVGAAFDVYSGVKKMAPEWMRRIGIEWIFRLSQDPKRLFKRYLLTNSSFLVLIIIEFIKIRLLKLNRYFL